LGWFKSAQPIEQTTRPPATWTTGIDTSKKSRTWEPMRVAPARSRKP
jgi:hypothetical protein